MNACSRDRRLLFVFFLNIILFFDFNVNSSLYALLYVLPQLSALATDIFPAYLTYKLT